MIRRPPRSTRTDTLFPYTTLFRSDQEFGELQCADLGPVEPVVGAVRRYRAQDRLPLHIVDRRPDMRDRGQQQIIFDVEDARGVVGEFEEGAAAGGIIAVVAQHRPPERSEERRVGKEGVSTSGTRWSRYNDKKKYYIVQEVCN